MQNIKNKKILSLLNSYLIDSSQPVNISYLWNFGSLLGVCLVIQIAIFQITFFDLYFLNKLQLIFNNYFEIGLTTVTNVDKNLIVFATQILFVSASVKKKAKATTKYISNSAANFRSWLASFDLIKGISLGLQEPTLPQFMFKYHNSLLGRIVRVVGGTCAIFVLANIHITSSDNNSFSLSYILIISLALVHFTYMFAIFATRFFYTIYHILSGKWICRNSPLKWIKSEGFGAMFWLKGVCYMTGGYMTMAGAAITLDHLTGEPYFCQLAVIKEPALRLKMVTMYLQNHVTIGNSLYDVNLSETKPSKVLDKVRDLNELKKFEYSILEDPERREAFKEIKKELKVDLTKEVQDYIQRLKEK